MTTGAGVERTARLFFALWPDEAMQAALARAVAASTGGHLDGRMVPPRNFHVTLAFLGSVPQSRVATLLDVAEQSAQSGAPLAVTLDSLEHWRKPQVLVATSRETPPAAVALADILKRLLIEREFSPDLKPFRVHATVARKVRRLTRDLHIEPVRWSFHALHLVESAPGSVYSTVEKWVLDKRD